MRETKEIVLGTKNKAKIDQIQGALAPFKIHVIGIDQFGEVADVEEDGNTLTENAIKKARVYATTIGKQVLSMDNGLYFDDLSDDEQPGTHVRRINGNERATDDEILKHYIKIVGAHGGSMKAKFVYAVVMAQPDGEYASTIIEDNRIFTDIPCVQTLEGYPIESICIDPQTNKYVAAMTEDERAGFSHRVIGQPLGEFVGQNLVSE